MTAADRLRDMLTRFLALDRDSRVALRSGDPRAAELVPRYQQERARLDEVVEAVLPTLAEIAVAATYLLHDPSPEPDRRALRYAVMELERRMP